MKSRRRPRKFKNFLMTVAENEGSRKSDIYVLSQVRLFPNHILRLHKSMKTRLSGDPLSSFPTSLPYRPASQGGLRMQSDRPSPALSGDRIEQNLDTYGIAQILFFAQESFPPDWVRLKDIIVSGFERH